MSKARGLGRGLDVLLPSNKAAPSPKSGNTAGEPAAFRCALEKIVPNRSQPRRDFDEQALEELAQSIRQFGLIEPLIVRRISGEERFEIVAGERRWRASQRAGLREVLVVVRELDDQRAYEIALIENVQREDLNPIEFAGALRKLIDDHGHTQESLASAVGKDRSTITNALRLLKLPPPVQQWVINGQLSEGHARALLGAGEEARMISLAEQAVRRKWSVRQLEAEVRASKQAKSKTKKSPSVRDLEHRLARRLGARCEVKDKEGKGQLVIHYSNLDELDRLLEQLL